MKQYAEFKAKLGVFLLLEELYSDLPCYCSWSKSTIWIQLTKVTEYLIWWLRDNIDLLSRKNGTAHTRLGAWNTTLTQLSALRCSNSSPVRLAIRRSRGPAFGGNGKWNASKIRRRSKSPFVPMSLCDVTSSTPLTVRNVGMLSRTSGNSSPASDPRKLENFSVSMLQPVDAMARNQSVLLAVPSSSMWERWRKDRIWKSVRSSSSSKFHSNSKRKNTRNGIAGAVWLCET